MPPDAHVCPPDNRMAPAVPQIGFPRDAGFCPANPYGTYAYGSCRSYGPPAGLAGRVFAWPGGYSEGETPDPIPNSAVKTLSADGTAS